MRCPLWVMNRMRSSTGVLPRIVWSEEALERKQVSSPHLWSNKVLRGEGKSNRDNSEEEAGNMGIRAASREDLFPDGYFLNQYNKIPYPTPAGSVARAV